MRKSRRRALIGGRKINRVALGYIDQLDVSMLCIDGSDGKSNAYQLTAIDTDGNPMAGESVIWSSSDESVATVSVSGVVSGVSIGVESLYKSATISCTDGVTVSTCTVTVFETMPSVANLYTIKGGNGGNTLTDPSAILATFEGVQGTKSVLSFRAQFRHFMSGSPHISTRPSGGYVNYLSLNPTDGSLIRQYLTSSGLLQLYNYTPIATPNQKLTSDVSWDGTSMRYNGSIVTPTTTSNTTVSTGDYFRVLFRNNIEKYVSYVMDELAQTATALTEYVQRDKAFIFQNYIRYRDTASRTNYTKIPNIGTLGSTYDLTANDIPELWFGV